MYSTMPEMTTQEIKRLGNENITYYDNNVNAYVSTRGSVEYFLELIGQEDNAEVVKDMLYPMGRMSVHTQANGMVTIKLMGNY